MRSIRQICLGVGALALFAGNLLAADKAPATLSDFVFAKADKNRDGQLSEKEAVVARADLLHRVQQSLKASSTRLELPTSGYKARRVGINAVISGVTTAMRQHIQVDLTDTDGNQQISEEEFRTYIAALETAYTASVEQQLAEREGFQQILQANKVAAPADDRRDDAADRREEAADRAADLRREREREMREEQRDRERDRARERAREQQRERDRERQREQERQRSMPKEKASPKPSGGAKGK